MRVSLSLERSFSHDVSIMVDVLRASTTITIALKIPYIIPTVEIEEALTMTSKNKAFLQEKEVDSPLKGLIPGTHLLKYRSTLVNL